MKIFTKSLLTLALLCVAGVANADRSWSKVAIKGWVHEYRDGSSTQTDAEALTDEEGAYKVFSRGLAESGTTSLDDWDSQFFVTWDASRALYEGDKIKITMQVKAETATTSGIGSQAHNKPGDYNYWQGMDAVNFTEEWTPYSSEKEVTELMAHGDAGNGVPGNKPGFYSIAFNLTPGLKDDNGPVANTYYFKDIVVELFSEKGVTRTVVSDKVILAGTWLTNGDFENDDLTSFPVSRHGNKKATAGYPEDECDTGKASYFPEIEEGEGIDGTNTRYLKLTTDLEAIETWGTQLFFVANQVLAKGTAWAMEMDIKADNDAHISTGWHAEPRSWRAGDPIAGFDITTEWQHKTWNGTVPSTDADDIQSIAFNLHDANGSTGQEGYTFYVDNVKFGVPTKVEDLKNNFECIQVLFTDFTNMPDLIQANVGNKSRQELPEDQWSNFVVTIDGAAATISSIEYDQEGQLYIFLEDEMTEDSQVKVKFTNPSDAKFRLIYTNGDKKGEAVENFEASSVYDEEALDGIEPFAFGVPGIQSSEPEDKSFGLDGNLNEFTVTFDKAVHCGDIEAKLDGIKLTVEYAEASGATITLKRTGDALAEGEHTITITQVWAATSQKDVDPSTFELTFTVGAKAMPQEVADAIASAQSELEESADERYDGAEKTALTEAIAKYEAEGATYTAPSQVNAAVNDLSQKTSALSKHRTNCITYDESLQEAQQIVTENAKFADHELYKALAAAVAKYDGQVLTDEAALVEAIAELKDNVDAGKLMFTEGASNAGTSGIAALVDRIRLGREALVNLGVAEDDEIIVAADKAVSDDEELAKKIQDHLSLKVCEAFKDGVDLFASEEFDGESGEFIPAKVDMSVFVKNPNIYRLGTGKANKESVPSWTVIDPNNSVGLYGSGGDGWGRPRNVVGLPEDVAFTSWRPHACRMEQTIEGLPAGMYQVYVGASDWLKKNIFEESFAYAITYSGANAPAAQAAEGAAVLDKEQNVSAFKLLENPNGSTDNPHYVDAVEVTDGKLTLGIQFGEFPGVAELQAKYAELNPDAEALTTQDASTQYHFDRAGLYLVGAIEGHDYAADYEQIKTGVNTAKTVKVRAIELYDLNGRRISKATKGLNIIKRQMSDGSVKTDKVVK